MCVFVWVCAYEVGPQSLEFWVVLNHNMDAENLTLVSSRGRRVLEPSHPPRHSLHKLSARFSQGLGP